LRANERASLERGNSCIKRDDDLGMHPLPIVIPVSDWDDRLPFERPISIVNWQTKLATSPLDGAECAIAARKTRPCMYRNVQPGDCERSFTPSPLV
jgi:hypothetical protein